MIPTEIRYDVSIRGRFPASMTDAIPMSCIDIVVLVSDGVLLVWRYKTLPIEYDTAYRIAGVSPCLLPTDFLYAVSVRF